MKCLRVTMLLVLVLVMSFEWGCSVGYDYEKSKPKSKLLPDRLKMLWRQASTYFFPPSIDFRRSVSSSLSAVGDKSSEEGKEDHQGMSGREKVKEAVAKSVEKGKTTVEESAKAAAHTAQDLLKNTFSAHHHPPLPEL